MNTTPIMHDNSNVKSKDLYEKFSKKLNVKYLSDSTQDLKEYYMNIVIDLLV
jgi:hypothetical protein